MLQQPALVQYSVFVSHSMRQEDLGIVYTAAHDAHAKGISCYIAERDWQFGQSLPAKIEAAIRNCDCFVAFWTQGGAHSAYVNQEIGLARGCNKPRILVVENGVDVKGFDIDKEHVPLDRRNPWPAITALNTFLSQRKAIKQQRVAQQNAGLFVLVALGLLALFSD